MAKQAVPLGMAVVAIDAVAAVLPDFIQKPTPAQTPNGIGVRHWIPMSLSIGKIRIDGRILRKHSLIGQIGHINLNSLV